MKRLTNREIKEYILANYFDGDKNVDAVVSGDEETITMANAVKALEKLAEYEDLEEAGRLIKLPCKVRDTVYLTDYVKIIEEKIENIRLSIETESQIFNEWEFGRDVFFTREEAEAALEKMKGE